MPEKSETKITRAIVKWLQLEGGDGYHVHGSALQRAGEPDIDGSYWSSPLRRWLHLKLEVKTATGKPSNLQIYRLQQYHKRGYVAGVVRSVAEAHYLITCYEEWRYFSAYRDKAFSVYLATKDINDVYNLYPSLETPEGDD